VTTQLSSIALTTQRNIQDRLGLTDEEVNTQFGLLSQLINAASGFLERTTGRRLASRTYTNLGLDGNGRHVLQIPSQHHPVTALTALTLKDASLTSSETINVSTSVNQLRWTTWGRLTLYPDAIWSTFPLGHNNVLVSFTGGLAATLTDASFVLEYDIAREACEQLVVMKYLARDHNPSVSGITMAGGDRVQYDTRVTSADADRLPPSLLEDILRLRRYALA
jgi:hypothetical protein